VSSSIMFRPDEVVGLIRPSVDAHTLGITSVSSLIERCGYKVVISGTQVSDAIAALERPGRAGPLLEWIRASGLTRLGLSYRLDPRNARDYMGRLRHTLVSNELYGTSASQIRALYFAGPYDACESVRQLGDPRLVMFMGDDSDVSTLRRLGVPATRIPVTLSALSEYDEARVELGGSVVADGRYLSEPPLSIPRYPGFGSAADTLVARLGAARRARALPLLRAHAGPYDTDAKAAILRFLGWIEAFRKDGHLDVLSLGTSQLTQERFGMDWAGAPNGGGLPINSEREYAEIAAASRPMLVRTYAGTSDVPNLAIIHERSLNIAWHALSLWWFSRLDGRGPNPVRQNLNQHLEAMRFIAATGKPLEANVPHHFAFRGGDDVTYILSAFLAARAAKAQGVRHFVLQVMLNTPRSTPGIQDLAKARATLRMVRRLEDRSFNVILQPRAGLDYFSVVPETAKAQLAAASVLMCEIEPDDRTSPPLVHVVSHSEARGLATPPIVIESLRLVRHVFRTLNSAEARIRHGVSPPHAEVEDRTRELVTAADILVRALDKETAHLGHLDRLYVALAAGFLAVPDLWGERDEFRAATEQQTRSIDGSVKVVDERGNPMSAHARAETAGSNAPRVLKELSD
jgi:hypothetical protein